MAQIETIFTLPSEEQITNATLSLPTGTEDTDYPLTNIVNGNPARPAKFAENSIRIVFDFGTAVSLEIAALIHTNFSSSLDVRWQGNATNVWTSPSLDEGFTIAEATADGFVPGAYVDLRDVSHSYRYWSLYVPANSNGAVVIGQVLAYTTVNSVESYLQGDATEETRGITRHQTVAKVALTYDWGYRARRMQGSIISESPATVREWHRDAGGRPFLMVPDPSRDAEAWMVRWDTEKLRGVSLAPTIEQFNDVAWLECGRGLSWL